MAIDSIYKCKRIYKLKNLDFVIGSDLIEDILTWKNSEDLIKEVRFFIIEREGYQIKSDTLRMLEDKKVNIKISTLIIPNVSSSSVRLDTNYSNLPESLINIIKKNNLYSSQK